MVLPLTPFHATVDDLVHRERETGERYELYRRELFAMAGGRIGHALLATNLARELGNELKDRDCLVLGSDGRMRVPATADDEAELYTFPDVSVVCGTPEIGPPADTLLNPVLLAEVVSPSTEAYDRGQKFAFYRRIPSLHSYVLLAPDRRSTCLSAARTASGACARPRATLSFWSASVSASPWTRSTPESRSIPTRRSTPRQRR